MKKKKAVIFDMDGVISDTQNLHAEVESLLLKDFGINIKPAEITEKYAGVEDERMFTELFKHYGIVVDPIANIVIKKWNLMEKLTNGKIKAIPYSVALIKKLKKNGFKLAIASASTKTFINKVLETLNVTEYFDVFVSTQDVKRGKPFPDIFLFAAKLLCIPPEETIVIEDGRSGMIGAVAANMKSIGLVADITKDYPATRLVSSLNDINVDMILRL